MILLALDTSGPSGSAALLSGDQVLAETLWFAKASHSAELPIQIQKICLEAQVALDRVDAFAVTLGPGSFTGLRVGISFLKGLALPTQRPVAGVSTLKALAFPIQEEGVLCPLLDARRDEIYGGLFERKKEGLFPLFPEKASSPKAYFEEIKERLEKTPIFFFGSGARRYEKEIRDSFENRARILDPSKDVIHAASVGRLGRVLIEKGEFYRGGVELKPNYLRASTPELKREKVSL